MPVIMSTMAKDAELGHEYDERPGSRTAALCAESFIPETFDRNVYGTLPTSFVLQPASFLALNIGESSVPVMVIRKG